MRNPELEAAIKAEPESDDGFLVYGDWLAERDDPRGELILVDRDLVDSPWGEAGRRLRDRRREILERHEDELIGPLAGGDGVSVRLEWHLGYVRSAVISIERNSSAGLSILEEILSHPSLAFASRIELGPFFSVDGLWPLAEVAGVFCKGDRAALRQLGLGEPEDNEWPPGCDVSGLLTSAPKLRELSIAFEGAVNGLRSNQLRLIRLNASRLSANPISAIECPSLGELSIGLMHANVEATELASICRGLESSIVRLGLTACTVADELCEHLALEHVSALDLSMSMLTDLGAGILASSESLPSLEHLDVRDCPISKKAAALLRDTFARVDCQPETEIDADQDPESFVSDLVWARHRRGHQLWREHAYVDAIEQFESKRRLARALGLHRQETASIRSLGGLCFNASRLDESIEHRCEVVRRLPKNVDAIEALADSYRTRGRSHQAEELFEQAIELSTDDEERDRLRVKLAGVQINLSKWKEALAACKPVAETEAGAKRGETWNILGAAYMHTARYEDSAAAFRKAIELHKHPYDKLSIGLNLGSVEWLLGNREKSEEAYKTAAEEAKELGADQIRGRALASLGHLYTNWGRSAEAMEVLKAAVPLLEAAELTVRLGEVYTHLAIVLMGARELDESEKAYEKAIEIHRATGNRQWLGIAVGHFAGVYYDRGELDDCERCCEEALEIARGLGDRWSQGTVHSQLGSVQLARGDFETAREHYNRSCKLSKAVRNHRWEAWNWAQLGRVAYAERDYDRARAQYDKAFEALEPVGDHIMLGRLGVAISALDAATGRDAAATLAKARKHLEDGSDTLGLHYADLAAEMIEGGTPSGDLYAEWLLRGRKQ